MHVEAKTSIGFGPPYVVTRKTGESGIYKFYSSGPVVQKTISLNLD